MMKRKCDSLSFEDRVSGDDEYEKKFKSILSTISIMMYTFGDVKKPLEESVKLMYIVLREQMDLLLKEAEEASKLRGSKEISHKEILFVMRKNKEKLRHLLQYLQVLDNKPSLTMNIELNEEGQAVPKKKRVKQCMKFLASIEDCREFTCLLDDEFVTLPVHVKKRLQRRLTMIECMKANEYEEFSEALQASFCQKTQEEFLEFLLQGKTRKPRLTQLAVIMFSFLARETIAEIVDRALLIKSNKFQGLQMFDCSSDSHYLPDISADKKQASDCEHLTNISEKEVKIMFKLDSNGGVNDSSPPKDSNNLSSVSTDKNMDIGSEGVNNSKNAVTDETSMDISSEGVNDSKNGVTDEVSMDISSDVENEDKNSANFVNINDCRGDDVCGSPNTNSTMSSNSGKNDPSENFEVVSSVDDRSNDAGGFSSTNSTKNSNSEEESEYNCISEADLDNESVESFSHNKFQENDSYSYTSDASEKVLNNSREALSSSEQTFQKTEESKDEGKKGGIEDVSPVIEDVSDDEIQGSIKNPDVSNAVPKGSETPEKKDTSSVDKYRKEEFRCRKPITPEEIREVFLILSEPSPLSYYFSNHPVRFKKKFCLAASFPYC